MDPRFRGDDDFLGLGHELKPGPLPKDTDLARTRTSTRQRPRARPLRKSYCPVGSDSCVIGSLLRLKLPPPG